MSSAQSLRCESPRHFGSEKVVRFLAALVLTVATLLTYCKALAAPVPAPAPTSTEVGNIKSIVLPKGWVRFKSKRKNVAFTLRPIVNAGGTRIRFMRAHKIDQKAARRLSAILATDGAIKADDSRFLLPYSRMLFDGVPTEQMCPSKTTIGGRRVLMLEGAEHHMEGARLAGNNCFSIAFVSGDRLQDVRCRVSWGHNETTEKFTDEARKIVQSITWK